MITTAGTPLALRVAPLGGGGLSVGFHPLAATPRRARSAPKRAAAKPAAGRRGGEG